MLVLDTCIDDTNFAISMNINMHFGICMNTNTSSHIKLISLLILSIMIILLRKLVLTIVLAPILMLILWLCPFPIAPLLQDSLAQKLNRGRVVSIYTYMYIYICNPCTSLHSPDSSLYLHSLLQTSKRTLNLKPSTQLLKTVA